MKRYAVIEGRRVVNVAMWDGIGEWGEPGQTAREIPEGDPVDHDEDWEWDNQRGRFKHQRDAGPLGGR